MKKEKVIKRVSIYASYLLLVWGFYRLLFKLPNEIEEIVVKPVTWLLPLCYLLKVEKQKLSSIGLTFKNIFPAIYYSMTLGVVFVLVAMISNFIKYGGFEFTANIGQGMLISSLALSFVTAISEEISFRGYIFNRLWQVVGNEWVANLASTIIWTLIHLPITIFVWKLNLSNALIYLFLTTLFGVGSAFVFARTKNIFSSILLHVLWEWPIILFR